MAGSRVSHLSRPVSCEMVTILDMLKVVLVMILVSLVVGQDTRDDGLCGPGNKSPNGRDAKCDHIPPFPTCCQNNGHCGWDCDDGKEGAQVK